MDSLDLKIVKILRSNGRATNATIARDCGVSEGTIRRRLKHLIDSEAIHIAAIPDPAKMGLEAEALVGVQVVPDKISSVASSLSDLDEVSWVANTTGTYDIFVWVVLDNSEALGEFLRSKVGLIPGIRRTETFVKLTKMSNHGITI
ncbi:MAG: Lrp/AsnC family transcriptional regulator [SAR202 cluster bacterium]|nr:Lrp/AsnC family transcriptional regulator [SAR202 cluster bacterium]|tara:strand:- start:9001 stop:9438 length:438 start_codon:yes stop_codon:yes gene_type:complete